MRAATDFILLNLALALAFLTRFARLTAAPTRPWSRPLLLSIWVLTCMFFVLWRMWVARSRLLSNLRAGKAATRTPAVLLIGGAGYIGSALLPKLLARGYRVRLLDSLIYGEEPIAAYLGHPNLELVRADFREVEEVVRATRDTEAVIHLGAIVGDPACAIDERLTIEINLVATRTIAEVAKGSGVRRLLFASTCSVYGAGDNLLDERSALNPVSLYAKSKIASERVLLGLRGSSFCPVILRFGTIYGLSGRTRFDLVVNLLTAKALMDGEIPVFGGDQWRPFLHVDDAAQALLLALEARSDSLQSVIFNVGSDPQNYTLAEVGRAINRLVPAASLKVHERDVDRRNYRVNFRRIRETLRFQPAWSLESGVRQVLEALTSGRVKDYRHARYSNAKFLSSQAHLLTVQKDWAEDLIRALQVSPPGKLVAAARTVSIGTPYPGRVSNLKLDRHPAAS